MRTAARRRRRKRDRGGAGPPRPDRLRWGRGRPRRGSNRFGARGFRRKPFPGTPTRRKEGVRHDEGFPGHPAGVAAPPAVHGGDDRHPQPRHRRDDGGLVLRRRRPAVAASLSAAGTADDGAGRHSGTGGSLSDPVGQPPGRRCVVAGMRNELPRGRRDVCGVHGPDDRRRRRRSAGSARRAAGHARLLRGAGRRTAARAGVRLRRAGTGRGPDLRLVAAPLRRGSVGARPRRHPRRPAGRDRRGPAGVVPLSAVPASDAFRCRVGAGAALRNTHLERIHIAVVRQLGSPGAAAPAAGHDGGAGGRGDERGSGAFVRR